MERTKQWFVELPLAVLFVENLLVVCILGVINRENVLSDLTPLMGTGKEEWIGGVSEAVMAMEKGDLGDTVFA